MGRTNMNASRKSWDQLAHHLPNGLLWISPQAPLVLGPDSYEWYRAKMIGRPDPEQVMAAVETIAHFLMKLFPHTLSILKNYSCLGLARAVFFPCAIR